jgi:hypothetical protein
MDSEPENQMGLGKRFQGWMGIKFRSWELAKGLGKWIQGCESDQWLGTRKMDLALRKQIQG